RQAVQLERSSSGNPVPRRRSRSRKSSNNSGIDQQRETPCEPICREQRRLRSPDSVVLARLEPIRSFVAVDPPKTSFGSAPVRQYLNDSVLTAFSRRPVSDLL